MKKKEIKEFMFFAARQGYYSFSVPLTKAQRKNFRKQGFVILPCSNSIIWAFSAVKYNGLWELYSLDENNPKYSFPEKLWIIATKERMW